MTNKTETAPVADPATTFAKRVIEAAEETGAFRRPSYEMPAEVMKIAVARRANVREARAVAAELRNKMAELPGVVRVPDFEACLCAFEWLREQRLRHPEQ